MPRQKSKPVDPTGTTKQKAVAFVNYSIPLTNGEVLKSEKGFAIFKNADYPNKVEDLLVALAIKEGGTVEVPMTARIVVNGGAAKEVKLDDIVLAPAPK